MITPDPNTQFMRRLPPWTAVCDLIRDLTEAGASVTLDGRAIEEIMRARDEARDGATIRDEAGGAR